MLTKTPAKSVQARQFFTDAVKRTTTGLTAAMNQIAEEFATDGLG
jgi:hypothetical protein